MRRLKVALSLVAGLFFGLVVGALVGGLVGWGIAGPQDRHGVAVLVGSFVGILIGALLFGAAGLWFGLRSATRAGDNTKGPGGAEPRAEPAGAPLAGSHGVQPNKYQSQ